MPPVNMRSLFIAEYATTSRPHGPRDSRRLALRPFGYRYSPEELTGCAPRVRDLASHAETAHVPFNNCCRDYAKTNAQQLATLLSKDAWHPTDAHLGE
jgi:uncharacterized protein YecE (DUF72 family)